MRISDWSSDVCSSDLRDFRDDLLQHVGGDGGDHVGVDIARRDRVHRDPGARAFLRQRLGEAVDARFGGGVIDLAILPRLAVDRTDVDDPPPFTLAHPRRSEEHTSELQSLMRISYAVFCLKKKNK